MKILYDYTGKPSLIVVEPRIFSFEDTRILGWLRESSIYDLDGVHLGWLHRGRIYSHCGEIIATDEGNSGMLEISTPHLSFEPLKPSFKDKWASKNYIEFFKRPIVYVSYPQRDKSKRSYMYLMQELGECKEIKLWECRYFEPEIDPGVWIQEELGEVDIFIFGLSMSSFRDHWTSHEFRVVKQFQQNYQKPRIIIIQIESREIPKALEQEDIIDFTQDFQAGIDSLLRILKQD